MRPDDARAVASARPFFEWLRSHCYGKANAKTAAELQTLGCKSNARELRLLRAAALDLGLLICGDNDGYFVPASREEADEAIGRMHSAGMDMLQKARQMTALADKTFAPQPSLLS